MRTIIKTVYKFEELSDEAKEKAINSFRDDPMDFENEADCIIMNWQERLFNIGFEDADIKYCGFYSQGQGASFTADVDTEKVINSMIMCNRISKKQAVLYNILLYLEKLKMVELIYSVYRTNHHYVHELTVFVDSYSEYYMNEYSYANDYFNERFEELRNDIQEYMRELCQEIFFDLRRGYEYVNSDKYIKEQIKINEMEFYEDGTFY
jgi:hypothetical protein